jgi:hypothetical protein
LGERGAAPELQIQPAADAGLVQQASLGRLPLRHPHEARQLEGIGDGFGKAVVGAFHAPNCADFPDAPVPQAEDDPVPRYLGRPPQNGVALGQEADGLCVGPGADATERVGAKKSGDVPGLELVDAL